MAGSNKDIKIEITAETNAFRRSLNTATTQVQRFGTDLKKSLTTFGGQGFNGITTGIQAVGAAATAATVGGFYIFTTAMSGAIQKASEFSTAVFSMDSSLSAANRQFNVGGAKKWEQSIKDLGKTLKIYSETELRNAASRTIDMTKRLGLSAEQMKKVIQISGELGAGKTDIVGAVERVTAALRGEAEASEFLGLTLNEDYVKAWYNAKGATQGAWKDLTDLEKAQIRFKILLEQSNPVIGRAAESTKIYSGALTVMQSSFGTLQKDLGGLVTNNTFVIQSLNVLSETFKGLSTSVTGNRSELVNLVKTGFLGLVDGIGGAIEVLRFFYNGWQGLSLAAHGAVLVIIKGMELSVQAIRSAIFPLDYLLTGMAKMGAIDSNPLKDWQETLAGVGQVSTEEFNKLLEKVLTTNQAFDSAKTAVEDYRKKIESIPAQYQSTTEQMKKDTKEVSQVIANVNGVWTNVSDEGKKKSEETKDKQISDVEALSKEIKLVGGTWENELGKAEDASDKATDKMIADINRIKKAASGIKDSFTLNNNSNSGISGYASGGSHPGGFRIVGERGPELEYTGASRIFNNGSTNAIIRALQSIPRLATGGPMGSTASASPPLAAGATYNITLNHQGGSSQGSAKDMAKVILGELQKLHRGRS